MLTLAAGDTLAGAASAASKVTCTVMGMELTAGPTETYKQLTQLQLALSAATIYTTAASTTAFVKTITVVNTDSAATNTFQLFTNGTAAANAITPALTIPAGGYAIYEDGQGWTTYNSLAQALGLGATGAAGATGSQGVIGMMGPEGDPGEPGMAFGYTVPRDAVFLGIVTAATTTVGPLKWTDTYRRIIGGYVIGGYNGGTPVGRLLSGAASISTTAATNGNALFEDTTKNTTSVSVPGCPLAVTLSAIARSGQFTIDGASGALKRIDILGDEGTPAVASSPVTFRATSWFSDLGTNLPIQQLQLSVYDTLTATSLSAQAFTATTSLWAWGIR